MIWNAHLDPAYSTYALGVKERVIGVTPPITEGVKTPLRRLRATPVAVPVEAVRTMGTAQGRPAIFPVDNAAAAKLEQTTAVSPTEIAPSVAMGTSVEAVEKTSK